MVSIMNRRTGYDYIPEHPLERLKPLKIKANRTKTFENWSQNSPVKAVDLVEDGFYYMGMTDKVQCAFCGGVLSGFEEGDNVHQEHARHFPLCPHLHVSASPNDIEEDSVIGYDSTPEAPHNDDDPNNADGAHSRGHLFGNENSSNQKREQAPKIKFPKYSTYPSRLESYNNWPENHFLKPQELASANLYYKGEADKCQCYICGGVLEQWEEGDDPKKEHERWFKKCGKN